MKKLSFLMVFAIFFTSFTINVQATEIPLKDSQILWVINAENAIDEKYQPEDMISVGNGQLLRKQASEQLHNMMSSMKDSGVSVPSFSSGYRCYDTQSYLFNSRLNKRMNQAMSYEQAYSATAWATAYPGTSEHQSGLAMDIGSISTSFGNTQAGKWLQDNSWRFGFILRYQKDKSDITGIMYEPWHFRYVGVPHAQIMFENNWCFEEYMEYLIINGNISIGLDHGDMYTIYYSQDIDAVYENVISFSSNNQDGYIFTTYHKMNSLANLNGHWSQPAFQEIIGEGEFVYPVEIYPTDIISKADFLYLYSYLFTENENELNNESTLAFTDIAVDDFRYNALLKLVSRGILENNNVAMNPDEAITREEVAIFFSKSMPEKEISFIDFTDLDDISGYAFQSVQQVVTAEIMIGENSSFFPKDEMKWEQVAVGLVNLKHYLEKKEEIHVQELG